MRRAHIIEERNWLEKNELDYHLGNTGYAGKQRKW
jgi:hypothetical protein